MTSPSVTKQRISAPRPTTPLAVYPTATMGQSTVSSMGGQHSIRRESKGSSYPEKRSNLRNTKSNKRSQADLVRCSVCMDAASVTSFPQAVHEGASKHKSRVCTRCWKSYVNVFLNGQDYVGCAECDQDLSEQDVKTLAAPEDYHRYVDKISMAVIKQDPNYRECPSANCSYGYIHIATDAGSIFRCAVCGAAYCISCEAIMHFGETCAKFQKRKRMNSSEQEKASISYLRRYTKPCPNCGAHIRKSGGCDHMTCENCRFQFCWRCFAPYRGREGIYAKGNAAHSKSCRYHSDALPDLNHEDVASTWARPHDFDVYDGFHT
ncbi:hypothetical protein M433DRAFT_283044 [Acidomyces richmondensis BFW]|nr:hypothetical protein M433DRAFT_283044 [Acidomyces richmondensis BFW]